MPKYDTNAAEKDGASLTSSRESSGKPEDPIATFSGNILDRGDSIIYAIVGACFFLGALFALVYMVTHVVMILLANSTNMCETDGVRRPQEQKKKRSQQRSTPCA